MFGPALLEKLVFVGLTTVNFSQILPRATVSPPAAAASVAIVIALNAALSAWLVRRGVVWRSATLEFVGMAVANGAIALVFARRVAVAGRSFDLPATLFALLLVTLLITLYDRFRPLADVRVSREARDARPIASAHG